MLNTLCISWYKSYVTLCTSIITVRFCKDTWPITRYFTLKNARITNRFTLPAVTLYANLRTNYSLLSYQGLDSISKYHSSIILPANFIFLIMYLERFSIGASLVNSMGMFVIQSGSDQPTHIENGCYNPTPSHGTQRSSWHSITTCQ